MRAAGEEGRLADVRLREVRDTAQVKIGRLEAELTEQRQHQAQLQGNHVSAVKGKDAELAKARAELETVRRNAESASRAAEMVRKMS